MSGRIAAICFVIPFAWGCGTTAPWTDSPDAANVLSDSEIGLLSIRFADEGPVDLRFRQAYPFEIMVEEAGVPVAGAGVDLVFEGEPGNSTLEDSRVVTDAGGSAWGALTAGTTEAGFHVRASLSTGETARLEIRVGPGGSVRVTVLPVYGGARVVTTYDVRLGAAPLCPAVVGLPPEAGDMVLGLPAGDPTFDLPDVFGTGPLRIVLVGKDAGVELLWGCAAGIVVQADGANSIEIPVVDLPWPPPGGHETRTDVSLPEAAVPVVAAAFAPFSPLIDGTASQGGFVLDGIVADLRARSNREAADILADRILTDGLDATLTRHLDDAGVDLRAELAAAAAGAATFLADAEMAGTLEIGEPDAGGVASGIVRWSAVTDGVATIPLGGPESTPVEDVVDAITFGSADLWIGRHVMPLTLGRTVEVVLVAQLDPAAPSWRDALGHRLRGDIACDGVAGVILLSADIGSVCAADCLAAGCASWIDSVVAASDEPLTAADHAAASVDLAGSCRFLHADGRLAPDGLCTGAVRGIWSGAGRVEVAGPFLLTVGAGAP